MVAYRDGEAVGWVSVGPRDDYARLPHSKVLAPIDDKPVWSIVCFVVGTERSRPGRRPCPPRAPPSSTPAITARRVEAYPVDTDGERVPAALAFKGTVAMFEGAGFEVVDAGGPTRARLLGRSCGAGSASSS